MIPDAPELDYLDTDDQAPALPDAPPPAPPRAPYSPVPHGQSAVVYAAAVIAWCLDSGRPSDVYTLPAAYAELALHGSLGVAAMRPEYAAPSVHDRIADVRRALYALRATRERDQAERQAVSQVATPSRPTGPAAPPHGALLPHPDRPLAPAGQAVALAW